MDHRPGGAPAGRKPWLEPRGLLLLAVAGLAVAGGFGWFRGSESANGSSDWHSYADYSGPYVGIAHGVVSLAALGAAYIRRPLGIVVGVFAVGVGLVTLLQLAGAGFAHGTGDGDEASSDPLGWTSLGLVVLGVAIGIADLVQLARSSVLPVETVSAG